MFIEDMSRLTEICCNTCADFVDDVGAMVVDSRVELLRCASYILLFTFGAGDEVYKVAGCAG